MVLIDLRLAKSKVYRSAWYGWGFGVFTQSVGQSYIYLSIAEHNYSTPLSSVTIICKFINHMKDIMASVSFK
jgi:hypothetical protein